MESKLWIQGTHVNRAVQTQVEFGGYTKAAEHIHLLIIISLNFALQCLYCHHPITYTICKGYNLIISLPGIKITHSFPLSKALPLSGIIPLSPLELEQGQGCARLAGLTPITRINPGTEMREQRRGCSPEPVPGIAVCSLPALGHPQQGPTLLTVTKGQRRCHSSQKEIPNISLALAAPGVSWPKEVLPVLGEV